MLIGRVAINPRGVYDSREKYNKLDLVYFAGNSYLSRKKDNNDELTNENSWQKVTDIEGIKNEIPQLPIVSTQPPSGIALEGTEWIMYEE